jgi:hypothetical protein
LSQIPIKIHFKGIKQSPTSLRLKAQNEALDNGLYGNGCSIESLLELPALEGF